MPFSLTDSFVLAAVAAWILALYRYRLYVSQSTLPRNKAPLPPGPRRLPLVGNVLQMPRACEWIQAAKWGQRYGDLVYLENFGHPLLFINKYETAVDLLERRSGNFSSRPAFPMVNDLQKWDWLIALMPYGDVWRRHRIVLHRFLEPPGVLNYLDIQYRTSLQLLGRLVHSPEKFERHMRTSVGAMILMIAYGHEVKDETDSLISLVERAVSLFAISATPGSFLVNLMPFLKHIPAWFPGASFQVLAEKGRSFSRAMLNDPHNATKLNVLKGVAKPSMTSVLIADGLDGEGRVKDEDLIRRVAGAVFAGGADTSVSSLLTFLIVMMLNPEAQRKGQEELDRVVGPERMPTFEDSDNLPYINAICLETLRWAPAAPMGGPHASDEEDIYNGYRIPKGTTVIANQWWMLRDPDVYHDPLAFKPERHIDTKDKPAERDPVKIVFGFGRRFCPGRHLAQQSIYMSVCNLLHIFDIGKPKGSDGVEIEPRVEYKPGLIRHPYPFKCSITPRSPARVALLNQTLDSLDV